MVNRKRNNQIKFDATDEEKDLIDFKIKTSNLPKGDCLRKLIIDGRVEVKDIEWEKEKYKNIHELIKEVNKIGVNINQIAKHCNEIGSISNDDFKAIESKLENIWELLRSTLFKD